MRRSVDRGESMSKDLSTRIRLEEPRIVVGDLRGNDDWPQSVVANDQQDLWSGLRVHIARSSCELTRQKYGSIHAAAAGSERRS